MIINPNSELVYILVIEDNDDAQKFIEKVLQISFPLAKIDIPRNLFSMDVRSMISSTPYSFVFVDFNLKNWGQHPEFGDCGGNIIPIIRSIHPKSIIVGISGDEENNIELLEKGADIAILKANFFVKGRKIDHDLKVIEP